MIRIVTYVVLIEVLFGASVCRVAWLLRCVGCAAPRTTGSAYTDRLHAVRDDEAAAIGR